MAPEQINEIRNVDIRADIYSLGCTLYKLLVGHAPFSCPPDMPAFEVMQGHLKKAPPPLRKYRNDVPAEVAAALNRMLAKDPARRFQTPPRWPTPWDRSRQRPIWPRSWHAPEQPAPVPPSGSSEKTSSSSLLSSATRFFTSLQEGAARVVHRRHPAGGKRNKASSGPSAALPRS